MSAAKHRFGGHMHPACAVRFPYRAEPPRRVQRQRSRLLAAAIGTSLALVAFLGLSGAFR